MKLDTSNLVCRLIMIRAILWMINDSQKWRGQSRDHLFKFLDSSVSVECVTLVTSNVHGIQVNHDKYFTTNDELPKGDLSGSRDHLIYFGNRFLNLDWLKSITSNIRS